MSGLILQFAFTYTDNNRQKMKKFNELLQLVNYLDRQNLVDKFATYADKHVLARRNLMIKKSYSLLNQYINARIVYNMLDEQALTQYLNQDDPVITKAMMVLKNNMAFPKAPTKRITKKKRAK